MLRFESEPPPAETTGAAPHFLVGQDDSGCWLAIETHDMGGGIFKTREDALHFVVLETGHRPGAVELSTKPLRLRF